MSERLFVHNRNLYERKMQPHEIEHAQVHTYQNAIMLPLQVNTDIVRDVSHVYRGGYALQSLNSSLDASENMAALIWG